MARIVAYAFIIKEFSRCVKYRLSTYIKRAF